MRNTGEIRAALNRLYSSQELTAMVFDNFWEVYNNFSEGQDKSAKIQALLEYCERRNYRERLEKIIISKEDEKNQLDDRLGRGISHRNILSRATSEGFIHRIRRDRPYIDEEVIKEYFLHTEQLIINKIWRFDKRIQKVDTIDDIYVPLSASISDRMELNYIIKSMGSIGSRKINNLNKFIKNYKGKSLLFSITGAPGSGKTFELVKLYHDYRKDIDLRRTYLPVLIFINELPSNIFMKIGRNHLLKNFLIEYMKATEYSERVINYFDENLYKMKVLFLLDALDEIPDKNEYDAAIQTISQGFIREVNNNSWRFLMSCRTEDYDKKIDLIEIEIQPLSADQIESFYKKRRYPLKSGEEKRRRQSWDRLKSSDMQWFQPYISNPYFLALMLDSIEDAILKKENTPINLRDLFRVTIQRELNKSSYIVIENNVLNTFEDFFSLISFSIVEKTSKRETAYFDILSNFDMKDFIQRCGSFKDVFKSLQLIHEYFYFLKSSEIDEHKDGKILELRGVMNDNIVKIILDIGRIIGNSRDQESLLNVLNMYIANYGIITEDKHIFASIYKTIVNISSDECMMAYNVACCCILIYIIDIGVKSRLLRTQQERKSVIMGFRHRRLMEYFAAYYIDMTRTSFGLKALNLWYKQTLAILAAITCDVEWFFTEMDCSDRTILFVAADGCQFLHPLEAKKIKYHIDNIADKLLQIFSQDEAAIDSYQSLKGMRSLVISQYWVPESKIIDKMIHMSNNVAFYKECIKILLEFDRKNLLHKKQYILILKSCLRNIISYEA